MSSHFRMKPIIQGICRCYDYLGADAIIKAEELENSLHPINQSMDNKHSLEALYVILATTMKLIEELECTNVTTVDETDKINVKSNPDLSLNME